MYIMNFARKNVLKRYNFYSKLTVTRLKSYTSSIFLPKTSFPFRLEGKKLIDRDKHLNKLMNIYKWQRECLSGPDFILHDGPPYANGTPHMGHAINKILKDVILRFKILEGRRVHYIPGWDCHGLPIELKSLGNTRTQDTLEIRKKARSFANEAIKNQKEAFMSWGVLGDWDNSYASHTQDYVKKQLGQFYKLYSKGLIYRDVKPVYWSPSTKTALAESELEYEENHKSHSIYLKLDIERIPDVNLTDKKLCALIWTTTPWTLPANQAICFSPNLTYCLCKSSLQEEIFVVALERIEQLEKSFECELGILATLPGNALTDVKYRHPIYKDQMLSFLASNHVTADKGTGLVHLAPAHGPEDFLVGLDHKLPVVNLVNDDSCYNVEAGPELEGKSVLEEGNTAVLKLLDKNIIHSSTITHSYPYDWRTKKPVIIRASPQWFLDTKAIKSKAIESMDIVAFKPKFKGEMYKEEFLKQIEKRPFWCISRQRKWGVPIPVFYKKESAEVVLNQDIIDYQCELIDKYGTDYWWLLSTEELLPKNMRDMLLPEIRKGEDILDIWFDSGMSWSNVLGPEKIADMYLEGVDQLNGWFYSSLITSLACRGVPPYKSLYIHGFAVDQKGLKMSKSLGNVVDPMNITNGNKDQKPFGVDILRWWVSCHANRESLISISENVLQSCSVEVQKIRSVLRFIVGALSDYKEADEKDLEFLLIDKYILHILNTFQEEAQRNADDYAFNLIGKSVINLLSNEISALYYPAIKDRLYCHPLNSSVRRSAQFVLHKIFEIVSLCIAPMLPHLIEELYIHFPLKKGDTFFASTKSGNRENWQDDNVVRLMNVILDIRKNLNLQVGSSCNSVDVNIAFSKDVYENIKDLIPPNYLNYEFENILLCANANVICQTDQSEDYLLKITSGEKFTCPRCRRAQSKDKDELCIRCSNILSNMEQLENNMSM